MELAAPEPFEKVSATAAPSGPSSAAAAGTRSPMRSASRLTNSEPTIAEPMVPPIWRKKLLDAVAVPTMVIGKVFCTISTSSCMHSPRPKPKTNSTTPRCTRVSPASSEPISQRPAAMITVPTTGYHL